MMKELSQRPTYSHEQITSYFTLISLPPYHHAWLRQNQDSANAITPLTALQQHQLVTVPFENLSLHYSPHHSISLDVDVLYKKIVLNGRGGYCMENNCFFATVLRSLGFTVYGAGARVCDPGDRGDRRVFSGWSHMVNIVTMPDGQKYMLDVGFGNDGPTRPLPLSHGVVSQGILPQELRLVRENLAQNTDPDQMLWIYQRRYSPKDEWTSVYCFTELEFLPQDYEVMNFWTSQSRRSWFTYGIIVVKMIMENETLIGTLILDGEVVKRRIRGSTEKWICKTEDERVEALKTWFNIELTQDERAGIRGLVTEL